MANDLRGNYSSDRRSGNGFGAFLLGIVFTVVLIGAGGWAYLKYGHPPVSTSDPSFPFEAQIVHVPLGARIAKELEQPPFGASEEAFETGAHIYVASCASCHGLPQHDVPYAKWMFPSAPQLWKKHRDGVVVGVSDDEAGETYWKVKNGIRLTGMPAYQHVYSTAQMWDVSLLLKTADQPLPDPVQKILADAKVSEEAVESGVTPLTSK